MSAIKYPQVKIKLVGEDGNAFSILGRCKNAMRKAKIPEAEQKVMLDEAMSGDYDHLLATVMKYFTLDDGDDDYSNEDYDEDEEDEISPDYEDEE